MLTSSAAAHRPLLQGLGYMFLTLGFIAAFWCRACIPVFTCTFMINVARKPDHDLQSLGLSTGNPRKGETAETGDPELRLISCIP